VTIKSQALRGVNVSIKSEIRRNKLRRIKSHVASMLTVALAMFIALLAVFLAITLARFAADAPRCRAI
jgi:hypothetical protein